MSFNLSFKLKFSPTKAPAKNIAKPNQTNEKISNGFIRTPPDLYEVVLPLVFHQLNQLPQPKLEDGRRRS